MISIHIEGEPAGFCRELENARISASIEESDHNEAEGRAGTGEFGSLRVEVLDETDPHGRRQIGDGGGAYFDLEIRARNWQQLRESLETVLSELPADEAA